MAASYAPAGWPLNQDEVPNFNPCRHVVLAIQHLTFGEIWVGSDSICRGGATAHAAAAVSGSTTAAWFPDAGSVSTR